MFNVEQEKKFKGMFPVHCTVHTHSVFWIQREEFPNIGRGEVTQVDSIHLLQDSVLIVSDTHW